MTLMSLYRTLYLARLIAGDKCGSFGEQARRLNGTMYPWGIFSRLPLRGHDGYNRARKGRTPLSTRHYVILQRMAVKYLLAANKNPPSWHRDPFLSAPHEKKRTKLLPRSCEAPRMCD